MPKGLGNRFNIFKAYLGGVQTNSYLFGYLVWYFHLYKYDILGDNFVAVKVFVPLYIWFSDFLNVILYL